MALLHSPLVFSLLSVLFISVVPQILTSSPRTEAEALVKWKSSLLPAASLSSWSSSHLENLCNWTGITCNSAGTVSKLNVSGQDLNGTLAHFSFSSFPNLSALDMSHNLLSDVIPGGIGDLAELQYLSFYDNYINGTIPYQISHLQKLQHLDLGSKYLASPDWSLFSDMPISNSHKLRRRSTARKGWFSWLKRGHVSSWSQVRLPKGAEFVIMHPGSESVALRCGLPGLPWTCILLVTGSTPEGSRICDYASWMVYLGSRSLQAIA